jgi:hypothetical protein
MVRIGNHMKFHLEFRHRERARQFYGGLLGCKHLESPAPDLDLYEFAGGFVVGLFFMDAEQVLSEAGHRKAAWLEIKVDDPVGWKARLLEFGVHEVEYQDRSRFYFQAPGGQVFRLAALEGGV